MKDDLKIIKKKYGEKMMHLCRELFPLLLLNPGLLSDLLLSKFYPSRYLYDDIVNNKLKYEFKDYIYSFVNVDNDKVINVGQSPRELLKEVGYELYECKTEKDINKFKKYYAKGEELCTFRGKRLDNYYVFFAVKRNVNDIRRENFKNPQRQDEYGTSVISLQFTRGKKQTLSIKNRYNHSVSYPDATFSNNLENIIPGLTESFKKEYNFNLEYINNNLKLPGYVMANDGKYYKYNYEINNIYYCVDNIIIDNHRVIDKYKDSGKYIIMDYFILDLENKEIILYDKGIKDSFIDSFDKIKKIIILKDKETDNRIVEFYNDERKFAVVELDRANKLVSYYNDLVIGIGNNFLNFNNSLVNINMPLVENVGDYFLDSNIVLKNVILSSLENVGDYFLRCNNNIVNLELLNLKSVGDGFLFHNNSLLFLDMPKLESAGNWFLGHNNSLLELRLESLESVEDYFLSENNKIISLDLINLKEVGSYFLYLNESLKFLNAPNLRLIKDGFLYRNNSLVVLELPNLECVGDCFLYNNNSLKYLDLISLSSIGVCFLYNHKGMILFKNSNLTNADEYFMKNTSLIYKLYISKMIELNKQRILQNDNVDKKNDNNVYRKVKKKK